MKCLDPSCDREGVARGLCKRHYNPARIAGTLPPKTRKTLGWTVDVDTGCWVWNGVPTDKGYGTVYVDGRSVLAHRWVYEQHREQIPDGLTIDHLCRNRLCVNPDHLEVVTMRVNGLRGTSPSAVNAVKTECVNGHAFDEVNTYWRPKGGRDCRRCAADRAARRQGSLRPQSHPCNLMLRPVGDPRWSLRVRGGGALPEWEDEAHDTVWSYEEPRLEVDWSEPLIVGELYSPDGVVLVRIVDREPIGYRLRE